MHRGLKYGCFGCLGVGALLVACSAAIFGIAYSRAQSEEIVDRSWSQPVRSPVADTSTPGRIVLDVSGAELVIEPAEPGDELRIDASYAENAYDLVERFEPDEGSGWSYEVRLGRKSSSSLGWLQTALSGSMARVRVRIPPDGPVELVAALREGVAEVELEGLWLTTCDLTTTQGEMHLSIHEPLREPMERLVLRAFKGAGSFLNLGNASPRELTIETSMGGTVADLSGAWVRDADVAISSRMGGSTVILPDGVNVRGVDTGQVELEPEGERSRPTLTVTSSAWLGDVEFRR